MGLFKFNKKEENMQRMNDGKPLMNAPASHHSPDKYAHAYSSSTPPTVAPTAKEFDFYPTVLATLANFTRPYATRCRGALGAPQAG